ncbi:MAG TPA: hypothetical protein VD837_06680 [Terriglobales bacterium]|nr:hypothetical protein [Terriglobales bacterium]
MRAAVVLVVLPLLLVGDMLAQTTTLSKETSNNTAACSAGANPSHCQAAFTPMTSSASGTFNPAPGNVSNEDVHQLLYPGATTKIFTYLQPWFCMQSGSTATGAGTNCNKHIQVGYGSNSATTVNNQLNDMQRRGFDGTVVNWYGTDPNVGPGYDSATKLVRDNLAARCSGPQNCPMYFAILADEGSYKWTKCPQNNGTDQTSCLASALKSDLDYLNTNYFSSDAYFRVNNLTQQIDPNGRPVVLFFMCEECWANPRPNWATIWAQVRAHTNTYGSTAPQLYFIFRNQNGFTHTESNGAFAWVNWYGSSDPYGFIYLDNFYNTAKSVTTNNPTLITVGAGWKGFDETLAPWTSSGRAIQQQCGNTWLQSFQRVATNNNFGSGKQLPFFGVVTWNDYEEGTQIETGIDNCLTLNASVNGNVLSWSLDFSHSSGTESTVHHYVVFDSTDGQNLTQIATLQPGTRSLDLSTVTLASGSSHTLYVKAVGKPSIQNRMSEPVTYGAPVRLASLGINPSSITGGNIATGTVALTSAPTSNTVVLLQSSNSAVASVPSSVTVPAGFTNAPFSISTNPVATATSVTVTAVYNGNSAPATLTVNPPRVTALSLNPSSVGGSLSSTATVTLNGRAPSGGAVVSLSSNNTAATVPTSVTIPAGSTSATFTVSTKVVNARTSVTIAASYGGASVTAALTVNVSPTSLTLSPSTVKAKSSSIGTVILSGPAPSGGAVVSLASSRTSAAKVPSTVTVPAGATTAKFNVTTSQVPSTTQATISATYFGVRRTATLTITR